MNAEWSLNELYTGLDDPAYEADFARFEQALKVQEELVEAAPSMDPVEGIEALLKNQEESLAIGYRISLYLSLSQSVNTEDGTLMAQQNRFMKLVSQSGESASARRKLYAAIPDIDELAAKSPLAADHIYMLKKEKAAAAHLLGDEAEAMISAMDMTGGRAWGTLQSYLTSTVKVDYDGKTLTLPEIRNLASSPEASVRRTAYEAELKAYEKIEDSVAFALNNIKAQVNMLCEKRGYASALEQTLAESDMKRETLDAMMTAIREYLPVFHRYLRRKGEMLGHKNGLPWYDLFAPMGRCDKTYTIPEAREYLIRCFEKFTPELSDMIREAFDNSWIDFYPRKGKEGGAFCAAVPMLKQSRILTNYDGTFGAVGTLAHELGHAFHNRQLENVSLLKQDSPMQVAETASTFNEVHLGRQAVKEAKGDALLNLLENDLKEQTQCIIDIYSRYLFETAVFEEGKNKFLMAADLKELMLKAQKEAYGDGLDPEFLHPYMWLCKGHYYSSGLSFYNFPYAFGNLFALGLYSLYTEEGESFIPKYKRMLSSTGCRSIEEIGAMMGIDLTRPDFWRSSLEQIARQVERFCAF